MPPPDPPPAVAAAAVGRGSTIGGTDVGGIGVGVVWVRVRGTVDPAGVRRSGSSCALLRVIAGSGQGRADPGPCVELILEDDRRRLAVDPGPIGVALGLARRAAGPAALHRTQAALGEVAGQALVAEGYRQSQIARRPRPPTPG